MHRRAFVGGSLALAATPFLMKAVAFAQDAAEHAEPVLPVTFTDSSGTEVTVTDVSRIIPLNGDFAEILVALGLEEHIAAVDISATYPESLREKPSIGYQLTIGAEGILQFQPTLVIANEFVQPQEVLGQLREAGVTVVVIQTDNTSIDSPAEKIRLVAQAVGLAEHGEELATAVQAELDAAREIISKATDAPKVLFLLFQQEFQLVGGVGTELDALLPAAGAINAAAEAGIMGFQPLTPEALVVAAPDIIITQTVGFEAIGGAEGMLRIPGVAETPAGANQAFFHYDAQYLLGLGPRTPRVILELARDFHPELGIELPVIDATPTA